MKEIKAVLTNARFLVPVHVPGGCFFSVVVRCLSGEVGGGGDTFKGVMEQVVVGVPASP